MIFLGEIADASFDVAHPIESSIDPEILLNGQSMRDVDVGRGKIHSGERLKAITDHVDPEDPDRTRGGQQKSQ